MVRESVPQVQNPGKERTLSSQFDRKFDTTIFLPEPRRFVTNS